VPIRRGSDFITEPSEALENQPKVKAGKGNEDHVRSKREMSACYKVDNCLRCLQEVTRTDRAESVGAGRPSPSAGRQASAVFSGKVAWHLFLLLGTFFFPMEVL
jgi:hypothetical protein